MENSKPIVGISCGDLNGIGLEVIIKTFQDTMMLDFCIPVLFSSSKVTSYHRKAIGVLDFSFNIINSLEEINPKKANLMNIWNDNISISLGTPSENLGTRAIESIDAACSALKDGKIDENSVIDCVINKNGPSIREIIIKNYRQKERLDEIINTATWSLTRMLENSVK